MVAGGRQCAHRSTITPTKTCSADLYRRIKRRVGCSLKRAHCKGRLVPSRKQTAHKLSGTKSAPSGHKRVSGPLFKQHSPHSYRQHNSGCLHKQRGGMKLGPLCAFLWRILTWCARKQVTLKAQDIPSQLNVIANNQTEWSLHPVFQSNMQPVASTQSGPVCHQVQQQAPTVCLTGSVPQGMDSGCTQPVMGGSGSLCLPTSRHLGQTG